MTEAERVRGLMTVALQAAVPLWVAIWKTDRTWAQAQQRLPQCGQMIAEHGDLLMYRSKKKGETAAAFNALAEGLALLSFCPGGVTFLGLHFETPQPDAWV